MQVYTLAGCVFLGGGLGALLRYGLGMWLVAPADGTLLAGMPIGTWTANVVGSFAIGLLVFGGAVRAGNPSYAFAITGVLGGFTTFSTFSLETIRFIVQGDSGRALGYIGASLFGALIGCAAAYALILAVRSPT